MKKSKKALIAAAVSGILNAGPVTIALANSETNETEFMVAKGGGGGGGKGGGEERGGEGGEKGGGSEVKLGTGDNKPVPSPQNSCKGSSSKNKKQEPKR